MPWRETTMLKQKLEFFNEWRAGNFSLSDLCREFEISRPTAYNTSDAINRRTLRDYWERIENLYIPEKHLLI